MNAFFAPDRILFFLMIVTCVTGSLVCEANASPGSDRFRVLMMAFRTETSATEKAIRAIQAQLSDLEIDFQVAWTPSNNRDLHVQAETSEELAKKYNATIVFWCDFFEGKQIYIYVSEPGGGHILVRSVSFEDKNQSDRFEIVAVILGSVVRAIAGGGHIGISPKVDSVSDGAELPAHASAVPNPRITVVSESQTSRPTDVTDKPHRRSAANVDAYRNRQENLPAPKRIDMAVAYGLTLYSSTRRFTHGVRTALAVRVTRWGRFFLGYRIQVPFEVANDFVSMAFRHHPFEVGFSRRFEQGVFFFDLGMALVNDPLTWQIKVSDTSRVKAEEDRFRWLIGVTPFVQLNWLPSRVLKFSLTMSADIYFNESRSFVERTNGDRETVLDPFKVRPQLRLGLTFFLF